VNAPAIVVATPYPTVHSNIQNADDALATGHWEITAHGASATAAAVLDVFA
jgi:hypothetical protein